MTLLSEKAVYIIIIHKTYVSFKRYSFFYELYINLFSNSCKKGQVRLNELAPPCLMILFFTACFFALFGYCSPKRRCYSATVSCAATALSAESRAL